MQMNFQRTAISGPDSEITAQHLQDTLSDFIDLTLQAKQAHWNVVGPRFRSLHLQLDQLVEHTRRFSDAIAERIVILGQPAHGSAANTDAHSKLDPLPATFMRDDDIVKLFVERLDGVSGRLRELEQP